MKVRDIRKRAKSKYLSIDGYKFLRDSQSKRCRSYEAGCVTCDTWRFYDTHGRFCRNYTELHDFMEYTQKEANQ